MPHFTTQDEFEPTPNSLLARAASGSAPNAQSYHDRKRSQRSQHRSEPSGDGSRRDRSSRQPQVQANRLSNYGQYGQGDAGGYQDLQYSQTQGQGQGYGYTNGQQYQEAHDGQWGAFAHGGATGSGGYGVWPAANAPIKPLYYEQDEPADEAFDVRADFDGTGPRWSERYGTGKGDPRKYVKSSYFGRKLRTP